MKKTKIKKDLFNRIKEIGSENKVRGITLISLVITIIILLILAGITISQLTGNGIFTKVKQAKQEYEKAQEDENGKISTYENEINKSISSSRINGDCKISISNDGVLTVSGIENLQSFVIIKDGVYYKIVNNSSTCNIILSGNYSVIARDNKLKDYISNDVTYSTNKLYLIYDGENINDSKINVRSQQGIANGKKDNSLYMKSASVYSDANSGYQCWQTINKIDVANYSKLCIKTKGINTGSSYSEMCFGLKNDDSWEKSSNSYDLTSISNEFQVYEYTINKPIDPSYVYAFVMNGYSGTYCELYVSAMWLE